MNRYIVYLTNSFNLNIYGDYHSFTDNSTLTIFRFDDDVDAQIRRTTIAAMFNFNNIYGFEVEEFAE